MLARRFSPILVLVVAAGAVQSRPLTLQDACRRALGGNPGLAAARAGVAASAAARDKAASALGPSVNLRSSYFHINKETMFGATPILASDTIINRAELAVPVYSGGSLQAGLRSASSVLAATETSERAAVSRVLTQVAALWFQAQKARQAEQAALESRKANQASLEDARKLQEAGVVTRSDVLRAEVASTSSEEQVILARNQFQTALAALKSAMGADQSEQIELDVEPGAAGLPDVMGLKPADRPEVEAARHQLKAAESQVRAAKGARLPGLSLVVDFENQPEGSEFPRRSNSVGIGLQASLNIFDSGSARAGVRQAEAAAEQARAELAGVSSSSDYQLAAARLALDSARARQTALGTQVSSAEESLRVVQVGYREGVNVLTDVLAVESTLAAARLASINADYDLKVAELDLLLALGQTETVLLGEKRP